MVVLGIDPGREKCGLAVVAEDQVLVKEVVPRRELLPVVRKYTAAYNVDTMVVGDGTGSREFVAEIKGHLPELPVVVVDERHSTEEARARYWLDHRPKDGGVCCPPPCRCRLNLMMIMWQLFWLNAFWAGGNSACQLLGISLQKGLGKLEK